MKVKIGQIEFRVCTGQNKGTWEYINSGQWEPHTFKILDFFTDQDDIVIDLGCWSGVISLYLANKVKTIYAIDPDPVCFDELIKNMALNPQIKSAINPYRIAISDKKDILKLYAREQYGKSSTSILARRRDLEYSEKVTTLSILDFITQEHISHVDFIKMDVEGAEFSILPKVGEALKKMNFPTLYISFHYQYLNENIYYDLITSVFLSKLLLKIEKILNINFFQNKIHRILKDLFVELETYKYIYDCKGNAISFNFLNLYPEFIKKNDLIFTNKKWN
jgi:FkbM family methyltransferase